MDASIKDKFIRPIQTEKEMTNEIIKLKDTNELISNAISFLLIWEKKFLLLTIKMLWDENKAKKYLEIVKNYTKNTRDALENIKI